MIPPYSGFAWSGVIVFGILLVIYYIRWGGNCMKLVDLLFYTIVLSFIVLTEPVSKL